MHFFEIKSTDNPARIIIVNLAAVTSLEMAIGRGDFDVSLELSGGKTKYTWTYQTYQEAQNAFGELKAQLGSDIPSVTLL